LQPRALRLRQIERQHVQNAQLIQNQFIDMLAAAAGRVNLRQGQRADDQLAQQRRYRHHLTAGRQVGARQRIDE